MSKSEAAYALVLADLKAKRAKIEAAIQAIEELSGERADESASATAASSGPYTGMSIHDAAKAALREKGSPMGNAEIASAIQEGGLNLKSADVVNTVGAVLSRRAKDVADLDKVGRGVWGLPEWKKGEAKSQVPTLGEQMREFSKTVRSEKAGGWEPPSTQVPPGWGRPNG